MIARHPIRRASGCEGMFYLARQLQKTLLRQPILIPQHSYKVELYNHYATMHCASGSSDALQLLGHSQDIMHHIGKAIARHSKESA